MMAVQMMGSTCTSNSTSLYVGDLEASVAEAQLYEIFNQVGQVVSIRVCRDLSTRRSLGYAYVNYNNAQDATNAIELLNFTNVNGKPMRIMYSRRDPSVRKSGTANIFIKNLDKSIDNKAMYDTFSAFGAILSCRVAVDASGVSKGYGFVQFEQEEAAQTAIENVNGMLINDKQVFVGPFIRRQERVLATAGSDFSNVYVKNLTDITTDEDLKEAFGAFGPITSAVVMRDADGESKCFGFVNFESTDDAAKAVDNLNGKMINGKEWYVGRAQKKSERETELRTKFERLNNERIEKLQGLNLYIKNIDDSIGDDKLRELFSAFGTITSSKVMRDPNSQSKGSGFVAFSSPDEALQAVNEMNGKMVGSKPLYVTLAERKDQRRAKLQEHFAQMRNVPVVGNPRVNSSASIFHSVAPGMGQQVFYGHPGLIPSQPTSLNYQRPPMVPGMRPGAAQMPNYYMPVVPTAGQQGQRFGGRRGQTAPPLPQQHPHLQQQLFPHGGNRAFRYTQSPRTSDATSQGHGSVEVGGGPLHASDNSFPMPVNALASALASASPEQQRVMLGEQLYPLVDHLECDHAGKVTGMLLELDQPEVLHLIESPEALKAKVSEAMDVLCMSQGTAVSQIVIDQLACLSMNEPLAG